MELGKRIRAYRQEAQLSQEELAERIYVTRQTVSNWENDKNYPDINSLIMLGEVFQVSLDTLIKGDIDIMKAKIKREDVEKLNRYGGIMGLCMLAMAIFTVPLKKWIGYWAFVPFGIVWAVAMFFAVKIEKIKKANDIHTYKEIVAFTEGKHLDEIQKQREIGKRPYQKLLLAIGCMLLALACCVLAGLLVGAF